MTWIRRATDSPGTTVFDGGQAMKGYRLNKMCSDFNRAEKRAGFIDIACSRSLLL